MRCRDRVEHTVAFAGDDAAPAVPRAHVAEQRGERIRQRALPEESVVGEQHRGVEPIARTPVAPRRGLPVVAGEQVVVPLGGRVPATGPDVPLADLARLARGLDVRDRERPALPGEPGVPGPVVDEAERVVTEVRVGVLLPESPVLHEVLVRVDDPVRHGVPSVALPRWPRPSVVPVHGRFRHVSWFADGSRTTLP